MNKSASFNISLKSKLYKINILKDHCTITSPDSFRTTIYEEIDGDTYKFEIMSREDKALVRVYEKSKMIAERHNVQIRYWKSLFK